MQIIPCDLLQCCIPMKVEIFLVFQEVLDLRPQCIMLMLHHDHMMAITLVENGNHHVTTPTPHEIMIVVVVVDQLLTLTIGRGVGKIALTGENLYMAWNFGYFVMFIMSVFVQGRSHRISPVNFLLWQFLTYLFKIVNASNL